MARILVIDDSEAILTLVTELLEAAGHTVIATTLSHRWHAIMQQESPDLVLTDVYMPDCDGLEIIQQARRHAVRVPFVAMTARQGEMSFFKLLHSLGVAATLQKPFTAERLNRVIAAALRSSPAPASQTLPAS